LSFHANRIMLHNPFLDQKVDIGTMWRNPLHEFLAHVELYGSLIGFHRSRQI
jgi:hypothetical protein